MSIKLAEISDLDIIKQITQKTIAKIYPHYYPDGAVSFFINHHNENNIIDDIKKHCVFLCENLEKNIVGTVTIKNNEILRLFVLHEYQGNGYGKELLDFAEMTISYNYDEIKIDSSMPAKMIYLKRGYKEIEYHTIRTNDNDYLCYDSMKKESKLLIPNNYD